MRCYFHPEQLLHHPRSYYSRGAMRTPQEVPERAQRLVQAGASLAARNRWDWGPAHMAAQSGCVPCLQWLAEQGQPLDEPAPASRGETPAMLAAAKGRIQALEWLEVRGVDLWRKDPHGKNALDWARFGKQQEAEHWLVQRQR